MQAKELRKGEKKARNQTYERFCFHVKKIYLTLHLEMNKVPVVATGAFVIHINRQLAQDDNDEEEQEISDGESEDFSYVAMDGRAV